MCEAQEVREKSASPPAAATCATRSWGSSPRACESLNLPDDPDQTPITYTAEGGSSSGAALRILAAVAGAGLAVSRSADPRAVSSPAGAPSPADD
ncbi:hypothetical protein AMK16_04920 [Streptomyces sp. CB00455]|uniref:hypothetical protein n=1 Tax=Streptomyces sp. CB00455 TaxID=1703927 RepID=UPI00093F9562|nr:hypothetical protein [Streptomyces sp. CB00455]OKK22472.1 hypothetical protein AMK16_04920 [Streptomyces sp. CB00455]